MMLSARSPIVLTLNSCVQVIALVNTLNQLAKSIEFASKASELEFGEKISQIRNDMMAHVKTPLAMFVVAALLFFLKWRKFQKLASQDDKKDK